MEKMEHDDDGEDSRVFLSGVIEGFYNRPWTLDQRLDLFQKLHKYKMNTYLYAPKDDLKHRSEWRQLYTESECSQLKQLITACRNKNILFIYGISPGLDMVYSDPKEYKLLVDKTKQIQQLGCDCFAILWDDIEPELSEQDAKHFDSFGQAHCKISNDLYDELNPRQFLFCPVEYCSRRADPNLQESDYLNTIGESLKPNIKVFWTGNQVVSPTISVDHIQALTKVIKRKPVIWDNLHANDYDLQRVYLGPYIGRERCIPPREYLSGCMTNPNCEYSLNLPALVTLADWVNNPQWDSTGVSSHKLAVKEMLAETKVPGPGSPRYLSTRKTDKDELTEQDMDMIFQLFWLPHSHGPKVRKLIEAFKFCRDNAEIMIGWKKLKAGEQPEVIDKWIDAATFVNNFSKKLFLVLDKLTHITNREMLYDLSSYLQNIRTILAGCNSYLKWIGIQECRKPFRGAPTLAGLPGGLAGDLARLYPIQSEQSIPLTSLVTPSDRSLIVLPVVRRSAEQLDLVRKAFPECKDVDEFCGAAEQQDCQAFILKQKQKSGQNFTIVGCIFSWRPSETRDCLSNGESNKKEEEGGGSGNKEELTAKLNNLFQSDHLNKYQVFIKIFLSQKEMKYLSVQVVHEVLDCLAGPDEAALLATHKSNIFQSRILQLCGYSPVNSETESTCLNKHFPDFAFFAK